MVLLTRGGCRAQKVEAGPRLQHPPGSLKPQVPFGQPPEPGAFLNSQPGALYLPSASDGQKWLARDRCATVMQWRQLALVKQTSSPPHHQRSRQSAPR